MQLSKFSYSEHENTPRHWDVMSTSFGTINLIVGKNAVGKTRLLKTIQGLCRLLSGRQTPYISGTYDVVLTEGNDEYTLNFRMDKEKFVDEHLRKGNEALITRGEDGKGKIETYTDAKKSVTSQFQINPSQMASATKRDILQHPYLEKIGEWAEGVEYYQFTAEQQLQSASVGPQGLVASPEQITNDDSLFMRAKSGVAPIPVLFETAIRKFGPPFQESVTADMRAIGFDLMDVNVGPLTDTAVPGVLGVRIREHGVSCYIDQHLISTGMWRAFCTVLRLNLAVHATKPSLLIVDDIGEGLDYERSAGLIQVAMQRAKEGSFQLMMSTNDRFIMNAVPLEHWSILTRDGSTISAKNIQNSSEEFKKFQKLGLNNFDYFVSITQ
jgi:energy-coupling factor transporter ATP-binding protein EcfA2